MPGDQSIPACPPPRVQAAQHYLQYAHQVRTGGNFLGMPMNGDAPREEFDLSRKEQAAYDAALNVMIQYFNGEQDFGEVVAQPHSPPPDDPESPVPSNT